MLVWSSINQQLTSTLFGTEKSLSPPIPSWSTQSTGWLFRRQDSLRQRPNLPSEEEISRWMTAVTATYDRLLAAAGVI